MLYNKIIYFSGLAIIVLSEETVRNRDYVAEILHRNPRGQSEGFIVDYTPKSDEIFDFIVVGAGSAGCVLANRLTEEDNWKVILLEAGGDENILSDVPMLAPFLSVTPMSWAFASKPQKKACKGLRHGVCFMPRGKVLGGSSVLNFLIYQRGHPRDFDDWFKLGNTGWNYSEVLPYFKKSENLKIPNLKNSPFHATGGYLDIDHSLFETPLVDAFKSAGKELGFDWNDPNGEELIGFSKPQATMRNGKRCSSSKAFLEPVRHRKNLKVSKYSTVTKLLIDPVQKDVYGVEILKHNKKYRLQSKLEVILSAGTFGSAQLLMTSGIGPLDHLQHLNISVIHNLPVGYNLQDHVTFSGNAFVVNDERIVVNSKKAASPFSAVAYTRGHGPLTLPGGALGLGFLQTQYAPKDYEGRPDIEIVLGAGSLAGDPAGILRKLLGITDEWFRRVYGTMSKVERQRTFTMNPVLIRPRSIGRLRIRSANITEPPIIDPNYFDHPDDMLTLREGLRMIQKVIGTKSFRRYDTRLHSTPFPGCERFIFDSDEYWECAIKQTSITLDHQVGTCKMGPEGDSTAVVSPRLKVHGISRLRVVDASIMPRIPAAHTHAPVTMIAEKAADMIKEDYK